MRRDFGCVLSAEDCTGAGTFSEALNWLYAALTLSMHGQRTERNTFTPYRPQSKHASTRNVSQINLEENRVRNTTGRPHGPPGGVSRDKPRAMESQQPTVG
jgi:hypothetical protein